MKNLTCYKYSLPFVSPLETSKRAITHREGMILEYTTPDIRCFAEAAPLPGFSKETIDDVQQELDNQYEIFLNILDDNKPVYRLYKYFVDKGTAPSLQFALDSLAYQLLTHQKNIPQQHLISDILQPVPVNGLIALHDDDVLQKIESLVNSGFHTFKAKVGINDFYLEYQQLLKIRERFPDIHLRIDANQSWNLEEATNNLSKCDKLNIQYCEEPLQHVSIHNLKTLGENSNVQLALDESLICTNWQTFLPYISYIVVKPMFLGCFLHSMGLEHIIKDTKVVITTSLESAVGRKITSLLVSSGAGSSDVAHGLYTGHYLAEDIFEEDINIRDGKYHPDSKPLWKNLKRSHLQHIATKIVEYS